jgi:hypothetical protein
MVSGEQSIVVVCACGKKLKAPAGSAGKKARCPACGNILLLTTSAAGGTPSVVTTARSVAKPPATNPADDDGLSAMYDLAEQAQAASAVADVARCPQCKSPWDDGAVLCTNCGYDTRTGKVVSSAPVAAAKKPKKPVDMMAPQGSFVAGLAMSAAFALAASVVWFLFAWITGFAISYIAILIGAAAGVGMQTGQKGYSSAGGAAAAGMTVVAILLAKLALVEFILLPIASHHNPHASIFNLNQAALAFYFFKPISLIIMAIGMGAAYRTANGSVTG